VELRRDQTLAHPATDPCRVRLGALAYSVLLLRETEVLITLRDHLTLPPSLRTPPARRIRLGGPAYSLPLLREVEALRIRHNLLTPPPTLHVLPAMGLHRIRLEAAACSLPLLQEAEALNTHRGLLTPLLPLQARALTRATTPRSRT
jgi:hypothetical protein